MSTESTEIQDEIEQEINPETTRDNHSTVPPRPPTPLENLRREDPNAQPAETDSEIKEADEEEQEEDETLSGIGSTPPPVPNERFSAIFFTSPSSTATQPPSATPTESPIVTPGVSPTLILSRPVAVSPSSLVSSPAPINDASPQTGDRKKRSIQKDS